MFETTKIIPEKILIHDLLSEYKAKKVYPNTTTVTQMLLQYKNIWRTSF